MKPNEEQAYIIRGRVLLAEFIDQFDQDLIRLARVVAHFDRYGLNDPQRQNALAQIYRRIYDVMSLRVIDARLTKKEPQ